jgi:hypothetical protein
VTLDYRVYGLTLRANRQLPHLHPTSARSDGGTVEVLFDEDARTTGKLDKLTYAGQNGALLFSIDAAGNSVWVNWLGESARSIGDAAALLLGPVLGGLLRLRGTVSLHACVVEISSRAIVLVGGKGAGKSTLAAGLAQRGEAVLSDDIAAIGERPAGTWLAEPGYPRLRLQPATIGALDAEGPATSDAGAVLTLAEKRYLHLSTSNGARAWRFQPEPRPVGAVYELLRTPGLSSPFVTPIVGAERLTTLVRHLRLAPARLEASAQAGELARLGRLASAVPMRRLVIPDDLDDLPAVCNTLVLDAKSTDEPG